MLKIISLIHLVPGVFVAIEEPGFSVVSKSGDYEVRKYDPVLVAETEIKEGFEDAGNKAFRILADYIFGNNKSKTKISMTAPVLQASTSEKIAMTAPVSQVKTEGGFLVQFTMPAKFNFENIPTPVDARVKIRQIPARKVVAYKYSGTWSESRYKEKLEGFLAELKKDGVTVIGEPVFARYNPPFVPWFLRRNEIWINIAD